MFNPKIIANLHATSHIQDRWQTLHKTMKKPKSNLIFIFFITILLVLPVSLYSQKIYNLETGRKQASKESKENYSPTLLVELGQGFFNYSDKNWTEKQRDSFLIEIKKRSKISFREKGFDKSSVLFAENRELKSQLYKSIFINGKMYGIFSSKESTGLGKICDLFFNNPKGTTISNNRYHISENYYEEYSEKNKSKSAEYPVPDSFFYFNELFDRISKRGSLFVIFYDKDKSDYNSVINNYKNIIREHQEDRNNIGLIVVDQKAFPNAFKQLATNKHLVNSSRYRKDFYVQLWYERQVLLDFYGHKNSKLNELRKILKIISNVDSSAIEKYGKTQLEIAKFKDWYKVVDNTVTLEEYMDSENADLNFYETFGEGYTSFLKIKGEMIRNRGELKLLLNNNNGLIKKILDLNFYDIKL